ncbi:MAG: UDP-N-acetylmuramate--L-alanine ligase [Candidatus Scalinduaceae bacterium]
MKQEIIQEKMNLTFQKHYKGISQRQYLNHANYSDIRGKHVYFIGIGGVGMSAIAKILIDEGCFVSGSDSECSPVTRNLEKLGAKINARQDGRDINHRTSLVITSAAIRENNPDLIKAKKLGLKIIKYSEFLGSLMKNRCGITVSGTHGKTTTSAMISTILKNEGYEPAFVIGGNVEGIGGSSCLGRGNFFIAEACEYDRTFLRLSPQVGVITNIEEDHLDYYKDIDGITGAFSEFVSLIPEDGLLVVNNDDINIKKVIKSAECRIENYSVIMATNKDLPDYVIQAGRTFIPESSSINKVSEPLADELHKEIYLESDSKWIAVMYYFDKGVSYFRVFNEGKHFGDFYLNMPGLHNVSNALAAITVCSYIGLDKKDIRKALKTFKGVHRRFQTINNKYGITIIDDYAHHPTEIRLTLETAKSIYPSQRLYCVFQPHQHNRTRLLLKEFAKALTLADKIIITDIYAARDSGMERASVSSSDLVQELQEIGGDVKYVKSLSKIINSLSSDVKKDDIILTMGAGNIWKVAHGLKSNLESKYDQ